jgi:hypothetical protein
LEQGYELRWQPFRLRFRLVSLGFIVKGKRGSGLRPSHAPSSQQHRKFNSTPSATFRDKPKSFAYVVPTVHPDDKKSGDKTVANLVHRI